MMFKRPHLVPLGFKASSMYSNPMSATHWYRVFPKAGVVIGLTNLIPEGIFKFTLSPANMRAFQKGKLSLVPPRCCNPSGGPSIEHYTWVHEGELPSQKALRKVLAKTGLFKLCRCCGREVSENNEYRLCDDCLYK